MDGKARYLDNLMTHVKPSNNKLIDRGTRMVMENLKVTYAVAEELLKHYGSVRKAIDAGHTL